MGKAFVNSTQLIKATEHKTNASAVILFIVSTWLKWFITYLTETLAISLHILLLLRTLVFEIIVTVT